MNRITAYFRDTRDELLNKVSWPSWAELLESTIIVLVASLIFSIVIFGMDQALGKAVMAIYKSLIK